LFFPKRKGCPRRAKPSAAPPASVAAESGAGMRMEYGNENGAEKCRERGSKTKQQTESVKKRDKSNI